VIAQRGQQPDRRVHIESGKPCPQGMTEVRRDQCQPPEMAPPSIVDYRPKSTVVAEEHLVPKAKFPFVDIHNHQTVSATNVEQLIKEMDAMNLRVMVNLSGGTGSRLKQNVEFIRNSPYKDRFRVFANVNFDGAGAPGWKEKAAAELETAIKDGAIGFKIFKNLGLSSMKADGSRLQIDDPDLDPLFDVCARLNVPVLIHTADPAQFFEEIDFSNERWLELALFPGRQYPRSRFPASGVGYGIRSTSRRPSTSRAWEHATASPLPSWCKLVLAVFGMYWRVSTMFWKPSRLHRSRMRW
jgi:hypothetical protein